MTTVRELIQYLSTVNQDAEVFVMEEVSADWSTWTRMIPLEIDSRDVNYSTGIDDLGDQIHFGLR